MLKLAVNLLIGFSTVPLFIGDENMRRKPNKVIGIWPRKRL